MTFSKSRIVIAIFVIGFAFSGAAIASEHYDIRLSFEESITQNWDVNDSAGSIQRTTLESIHGGYSALIRTNTESSTNYIETKEKGVASNENFTVHFDVKHNGSQTENYYRITDGNGNYMYIYEARLGTFTNTAFYSPIVENVSFSSEPPDGWNTITMKKRGDELIVSNGVETETGDFTGEFEEPENTTLSIEVIGLQSADMDTLVDNVRINTQVASLTDMGNSDVIFISAILFIILWAGIRLRSAVTVVSWMFMAITLVGILAFDLEMIYFWISFIIAIMSVCISLVVAAFYNEQI